MGVSVNVGIQKWLVHCMENPIKIPVDRWLISLCCLGFNHPRWCRISQPSTVCPYILPCVIGRYDIVKEINLVQYSNIITYYMCICITKCYIIS